MKILLITVRSDFGGGPRHVNQLVKALPDDIDLYMAYPMGGDPYGKQWESNSRIKNTYHIPFRAFSFKALCGLCSFIKTNKIEIVHSHGNGAGFYSRLLKIMCPHIKVVHTFHGVSTNYESKIKQFVVKNSNRFLRYFTDAFICVSKGEENIAFDYGYLQKEKTQVIYNGIPLCNLKRNIPSLPTIVTISRFDYQKNMDRCLEIVRKFVNYKVRFVWVGDGPDFERLKNTAVSEKLPIVFVGFSKSPMDYLTSSSIYLSTSRFEGLPYALIESLSIGLPIVATNVVGNNEVVIQGKSGYLYQTDDEAVVYINQLLADDKLYNEFSENAKSFFISMFDEKTMVENLKKLYNKLDS